MAKSIKRKEFREDHPNGYKAIDAAMRFIQENVCQNDLVNITEKFQMWCTGLEFIVTVWYWKEG